MKPETLVGHIYIDIPAENGEPHSTRFHVYWSDLTVEAQALILAGEAAKEKETDETLDRR